MIKAYLNSVGLCALAVFAHKSDLEQHHTQALEYTMGRMRAQVEELRERRVTQLKLTRAAVAGTPCGESQNENGSESEDGGGSDDDEEFEELGEY